MTLGRCRDPVRFLTEHWRRDPAAPFAWARSTTPVASAFLMALLFFGGVMNLYWIGGIAAYVLLEKLLPMGHWLGYAVGVALAAAGLWLLATA